MKVQLANPRGFCAGVERAIGIVESALDRFGTPVYVRHEVVHNKHVVEDLRERGAIFVEELDEVPDDSLVIFSAHGVSEAVEEEAKRRGLRVFDATCPLVTKVHSEVGRHARGGEDVILIGHAGHPEVEGTLGRYPEAGKGRIALVESVDDVNTLEVRDPGNLAYVTQTTLSMDDTADIIAALRARFPEIRGPRKDDICYATQNRQDAVKGLTETADLVLVVGSKNSSNSNRLREIAERSGRDAYLVDGPQDIDPAWLDGHTTIGVTAGASAPELLVTAVIEKLRTLGVDVVDEADGKRETVTFPLPRELRA
ncbi:MAG: 4-hydroxy-3-methylbut-2-enyl diphosphate reductase [Gammaproteobacteria bacterium]